MDEREYYSQVFEQLTRCFEYADYCIATGAELEDEGGDSSFPSLVRPVSDLYHLTVERALQVHLPVIGSDGRSVLMPLDFEIYLSESQDNIYSDQQSHRHHFKQTLPMIDFIRQMFVERGMPFLLDYTTAGGHILFQNPVGTPASRELAAIGYLDQDLIRLCQEKVPGDIRRHNGISFEAASVFSGLTKLACYISFKTMQQFRDNERQGRLPVTLSDTRDYCINFDNSWCEGSPHMRSIRSPFSLHKKNREIYQHWEQPSLVDVIGCVYDGKEIWGETDADHIVDCMWDLGMAAERARLFDGHIPCANDSLIDFIDEYRRSDLCAFRAEFENQLSIPHGEAIGLALREDKISDYTRNILLNPNPLALQPANMMRLVYDFIEAGWTAKNAANILRDLYLDDRHGWQANFHTDYPAEEKANFWARSFAAIYLWERGKLKV